jgi:hypothetical protein
VSWHHHGKGWWLWTHLVLNYSPSLQRWTWRQYLSPKHWYLPTSLHGVTTLNNNIVMSMLVFWVLMFRRNILQPTSALQPRRRRQYVPLKRWYLPTSAYGVTTQKSNIDMTVHVCSSWHLQFITSIDSKESL